MATTTTHEPTRTEHRQNGRPSIVAGDTEARPGFMTTEFWLTMLVAIAVVAISYVDDSYSVDLGLEARRRPRRRLRHQPWHRQGRLVRAVRRGAPRLAARPHPPSPRSGGAAASSPMFFFFSNRLGCGGSLLVSLVISVILLAMLRAL